MWMPSGQYDAVVFWNVKARYIAQSGDPSLVFRLPFVAHTDYPPLVPMLVGFGWQVFGYYPLVPIIIHGAFLAGMTVILGLSLPFALALIATITAAPFAAQQYADLPLAFFVMAAFSAYRWQRSDMLIGLLFGLAFLTKNEGILLTGCALVVITLERRRIPFGILAGLSIPALALILFRMFVATAPNDLMSSDGIFERLFDLDRYAIIFRYAWDHLFQWRLSALIVILIVAGAYRRRVDRTLMGFVMLAVIGYTLIYALTPHDLDWHLSTSFDRLVLHLFPVFTLALGLRVLPVQDARITSTIRSQESHPEPCGNAQP